MFTKIRQFWDIYFKEETRRLDMVPPRMQKTANLSAAPGIGSNMAWYQNLIALPPYPRGFHIITREVLAGIPELPRVRTGLFHVFIQHTSASLSINENADADVPLDLEDAFASLAPENFPHRHTCEGSDDMPAHVKASLLGSNLLIPVAAGRLCLGTWQGIYLCEHRRRGGSRRLVLTLWGEDGTAM
jgi:secondary thiamine-phosphate synthase enzyme